MASAGDVLSKLGRSMCLAILRRSVCASPIGGPAVTALRLSRPTPLSELPRLVFG